MQGLLRLPTWGVVQYSTPERLTSLPRLSLPSPYESAPGHATEKKSNRKQSLRLRLLEINTSSSLTSKILPYRSELRIQVTKEREKRFQLTKKKQKQQQQLQQLLTEVVISNEARYVSVVSTVQFKMLKQGLSNWFVSDCNLIPPVGCVWKTLGLTSMDILNNRERQLSKK